VINFNGDNVHFPGTVTAASGFLPARDRSAMLQETSRVFPIDLNDCFIADTGAKLPTIATGTQLSHISGTYGTNSAKLSAGDCKALGATTRRARVRFDMPDNYVAAGNVTLRASVGMETTVADTSCTFLIQARKLDRVGGVGSELPASSTPVTMNSVTFSDKSFALTASGLLPGDQLDIQLTIVCTDAATATAVKPTIASLECLCTVQG